MIEAFAALPLMLAGERSFLHFPRSDEVRIQAIAKSDNERDWPFTVDSGSLTCVWSAGEPVVMFFAKTAESFDESERHSAFADACGVHPPRRDQAMPDRSA